MGVMSQAIGANLDDLGYAIWHDASGESAKGTLGTFL